VWSVRLSTRDGTPLDEPATSNRPVWARHPLVASDGSPPILPESDRCHLACPRCKTSVLRIRRRLIDRLISAVYPVHRYRCHSFICHWEGNLPYKAPASSIAPAQPAYVASIEKNATRPIPRNVTGLFGGLLTKWIARCEAVAGQNRRSTAPTQLQRAGSCG